MGLDEIAKETLVKHFFAFSKKKIFLLKKDYLLAAYIKWKRRQGEFHLFNPQTIHLLQYATKMFNDYQYF